MNKPTTRLLAGANEPPPPGRPVSVVGEAAPAPHIEFNSSALDTLTLRLAQIEALASCASCLSAHERTAGGNYAGYELIDDALPLLGTVLMQLSKEARGASDHLWDQYSEARDLANELGARA